MEADHSYYLTTTSRIEKLPKIGLFQFLSCTFSREKNITKGEMRKIWSKSIGPSFSSAVTYFLLSNGFGPPVFMVFNRASVITILTLSAGILGTSVPESQQQLSVTYRQIKVEREAEKQSCCCCSCCWTMAWIIVRHLAWEKRRGMEGGAAIRVKRRQ